MTDEASKNRAEIAAVRLAGDGDETPEVEQQAPEDELLWKVVMDEPWDTALGWADARMDVPAASPEELDQIMKTAILELQDEGFARFFEFEDFGESYSRTPTEDEYLSRQDLEHAIESGSADVGGRLSAPCLGIRATESGRERVFTLWPEDRARWESFRLQQPE